VIKNHLWTLTDILQAVDWLRYLQECHWRRQCSAQKPQKRLTRKSMFIFVYTN